MKKHTLILVLSILYIFMPLWQVFATDSFSEGESLFRQNKPLEALPFLELAVSEELPLPDAFNYLGLIYTQLRQFDKAVETFLLGTEILNADKALLLFNAGNAAFSGGDYLRAVELYTACFEADNAYAKAILNRANAHLRKLSLKPAYDDYSLYLVLDPNTVQRMQIEQLLAILQTDIMSEEMLKLAQQAQQEAINQQIENQRRLEELQAQTEANAQRAREEEQKRLLAEEQQKLEDAKREALRLETERITRQNEELALKAQQEEAARVAAEQIQAEQERLAAIQAETARIQEEARIAAEEQMRLQEAERLAAAERLKAEQERVAAIQAEAIEAEKRRAEEFERIAEEAARADAEAAARLASEQSERDAERRRLLEEISSSLQGSDSENISAGAGGAFGYEYEPTID